LEVWQAVADDLADIAIATARWNENTTNDPEL
jgi:hypothetical protein